MIEGTETSFGSVLLENFKKREIAVLRQLLNLIGSNK